MIAYAPALDMRSTLIGRTEIGASDAASSIDKQLKQFVTHYSGIRLQLLGQEIMSLVQASADSAGDREMLPIDYDTAQAALKFAVLLPKSLPLPEVAPDPDGEISFDWLGKAGKIFSVSIGANGSLSYAGRFGEKSKIHGIEELSESCPEEILRGIEKAIK